MTTRSFAPTNFSSGSVGSPGSSRARRRRTALLGAGTLLAIGCAEAPFSLHTQDNDLQTLKPTLARLQQAPVPKAPMNGSGHAMVYVFAGPERRGPKEAAPPAEVERTLIGYDLTDGKQVFAVPAEVRSRFAVAQGVIFHREGASELVLRDAQSGAARARVTLEPGETLAGLTADEARAESRRIWDSINGPNLDQNIVPTRSRATLVLRKGSDHSVSYVRLRKL